VATCPDQQFLDFGGGDMRAWRRSSGAVGLEAVAPVLIAAVQDFALLTLTFDLSLMTEPWDETLWAVAPANSVDLVSPGPGLQQVVLSLGLPTPVSAVEYTGGEGTPGSLRGLTGIAVEAFAASVPFPT